MSLTTGFIPYASFYHALTLSVHVSTKDISINKVSNIYVIVETQYGNIQHGYDTLHPSEVHFSVVLDQYKQLAWLIDMVYLTSVDESYCGITVLL